MKAMRRIGDNIEWNTKSGIATGIVEKVIIRAIYLVKIDYSTQYVELMEDVEPSELGSGDPNTEFLQVVQEMRDAQKRYFDTRDTTALNESRRLEKKVDAIIEMCQTPNLFNGSPEARVEI